MPSEQHPARPETARAIWQHAPTTYLESADSTGAEYHPPGEGDDRSRTLAAIREHQLFLEIVAALAMGRTVVIPQPFALDSLSFQRVARRVWKARNDVNATVPTPIRLHLNQASSFKEAVSTMLARTGPNGSFYSSAFPELNRGEWHLDCSGGADEVLSHLDPDDERKSLLELVRDEFSTTGPNLRARPAPSLTLGELLNAALQTAPLSSEPQLVEAIRDAAIALGLGAGGFNARSYLRHGSPWPGDKRGRSARQIVGDETVLAAVTEMVDTLYNRVVGHTTGAVFGSFTTPINPVGKGLLQLGLSQGAALETIPAVDLDDGTAAEFSIETIAALRPSQVASFVEAMSRAEDLDVGLRALFRARDDRTEGSEFWRSLQAIADARSDEERASRRSAHLDLVADTLGRGYHVRASDLRLNVVSLSCVAVGTGAGALISAGTNPVGAAVCAAISIGGTAVPLLGTLARHRVAHAISHDTRRALGHVLLDTHAFPARRSQDHR
ncbi:MAG: hypothetical protein QM779_02625 [Propionicimonas sp.]|uniref:hypothetical protein n=1 Tax=Propionicimonas sp. TaxID=1955623 RepID=UPI003D0C912D